MKPRTQQVVSGALSWGVTFLKTSQRLFGVDSILPIVQVNIS